MSTVAAFLLALAAALALTPVARLLAVRLGVLDHAQGARKVHCAPTPRLGGVAIVVAFYLALALVLLLDGDARALWLADDGLAWAIAAGGLAIAALGLRDDVKGVPARTKLAVELAVAGLLFAAGLRIDAVALPLLGTVQLGWLSLPVTLLWVAGVTNAVNLIDGLDGLAAGVAGLAAAATGLLAILGGSPLVALPAAALAGAAAGFLRYNFNPATTFMGDTGSLFLGFVLAALSLKLQQGPSTAIGLLASVLVLGVPLVDTSLAVVRRALRGAPIFGADRGHIHHRLLAGGLSHRAAVLVLYATSVLLAAGGVLVALGGEAAGLAVLCSMAVAGLAALSRIGALGGSGLGPLLEERRRNLVGRAGLRRLRTHLLPPVARTAPHGPPLRDREPAVVRLEMGR
jgi:UDP-GlcNAc:undecaprenyl-phosphate GlcNAc-1-phosphate transferase